MPNRREFIKKAAYTAPAILTLKVSLAEAQTGSTRPVDPGPITIKPIGSVDVRPITVKPLDGSAGVSLGSSSTSTVTIRSDP